MKLTKNLLYAAILTVFSIVSSNANILMVTSNADAGPGSLREQISFAVTGDTVMFSLNPAGDTIYLTSGVINVSSDIVIIGPGPDLLALDGQGTNRAFTWGLNGAIQGMTIMNCNQSATDGGAIVNTGSLNLRDVVFHDNYSGNLGGAVANYGQMMIDDCEFMNNAAVHGGAFFCSMNGSAMIDSTIFIDNTCLTYGGAVRTVTNVNTMFSYCLFDNNGTQTNGGAVYIDATASGVVDFVDCEFTRNFTNAVGQGGAIFIGGGIITLNNCKLTHNQAIDGAAINVDMVSATPSVGLSGVTIENNTASNYGGGIYDESDGTILINNSTIADNNANYGAGFYSLNSTNTTINNSTINNNEAAFDGGGILSNNSTINITNCTVSGNVAAINGGGVAAQNSAASVNLINVTVAENEATTGFGGGIGCYSNGYISLLNTLIGKNAAALGPNTFSSSIITSIGNNLIEDSTGINTPMASGDLWGSTASPILPLISELAYFNGPTKVHHPSCNSPAVNMGATAGAPAQDQRGFNRVGQYDIGAVEHQTPTASPPTATLSGNTEICQDGLGGDSLTVSFTGTAPFSVLVTDGIGFEEFNNINVTTYKWRPTEAGTYGIVTVVDAGCGLGTGSGSINVPNTALDISFSGLTQASCGNNDGSVTAVVSGGTGPFNYQWSNGDQTLAASNMAAGNYLFIVTDNGTGCWTEKNAFINDNGGINIGITSANNVSCMDSLDGSIDINVSGGVPPYIYSWSNGETTQDISGLSAGPYEVKVTDSNGCEAHMSGTITQPAELEVEINTTPASCTVSDGTATAVVTGGTAGYSYSWSSGGNGITETGLPFGFYDVTVTDANGCTAKGWTGISEAGAPSVMLDSITSSHCSLNNGNMFISLSGGSGNYAIDWNSGLSSMEDLMDVPKGNYFCLTTDNTTGCRVAKHWWLGGVRPDATPICLASVDSSTQNNLIAWEKTPGLGIKNYLVYRGTSDPSTFTLIANVPYDSLSEFVDTVANTKQQWWRYKLRTIDSCGVGSLLSDAVQHKTIQLTIDTGATVNDINLTWSHYSGYDYTQYDIYRFENTNGWTLVNSVPPTQNTYQDVVTDTSGLYYVVIAPHPATGCLVTRAAGNNNTSRSNEAELSSGPGVNSIPENQSIIGLELYPNPNNGKFDMLLNMRSGEEVTLNIYDAQGKLIESEIWNTIEGSQIRSFDFTSQNTSVYTIQMIAPDHIIHKRIIIK